MKENEHKQTESEHETEAKAGKKAEKKTRQEKGNNNRIMKFKEGNTRRTPGSKHIKKTIYTQGKMAEKKFKN